MTYIICEKLLIDKTAFHAICGWQPKAAVSHGFGGFWLTAGMGEDLACAEMLVIPMDGLYNENENGFLSGRLRFLDMFRQTALPGICGTCNFNHIQSLIMKVFSIRISCYNTQKR